MHHATKALLLLVLAPLVGELIIVVMDGRPSVATALAPVFLGYFLLRTEIV